MGSLFPAPNTMQLRVARLCLDCEELYVGESCPICASERFAFLSNWLPSEERRRWRRPAPKPGQAPGGRVQTLLGRISAWLGNPQPDPAGRTLRTRASDRVPNLDFEGKAEGPKAQTGSTQEPARVLPPRT
jgi:hypothetical protein